MHTVWGTYQSIRSRHMYIGWGFKKLPRRRSARRRPGSPCSGRREAPWGSRCLGAAPTSNVVNNVVNMYEAVGCASKHCNWLVRSIHTQTDRYTHTLSLFSHTHTDTNTYTGSLLHDTDTHIMTSTHLRQLLPLPAAAQGAGYGAVLALGGVLLQDLPPPPHEPAAVCGAFPFLFLLHCVFVVKGTRKKRRWAR